MKTVDISVLTEVEDFALSGVLQQAGNKKQGCGCPVQTFIDEDGQVVFNADDVEKALGLETGEMQEILQHINSQS